MKRIQVVLVIILLSIAVIIPTYGYYRQQTIRQPSTPPKINISKVDFNIVYNGNFTDYVTPSVGTVNGTPYVEDMYELSGRWYIDLEIHIVGNSSNPLCTMLDKDGYHAYDSVVLQSVNVTTRGFAVSEFLNKQGGNTDVIYYPTVNYFAPLTLELTTMSYSGPLSITMSFVSPAQNLVFYYPAAFLYFVNGTNPGVYIQNPSATTGVAFCNHTVDFQMTLESPLWNFTVSNVSVFAPFKLVSAMNYTEHAGKTSLSEYTLTLNIDVVMPDYSYTGSLIMDIYTENVS